MHRHWQAAIAKSSIQSISDAKKKAKSLFAFSLQTCWHLFIQLCLNLRDNLMSLGTPPKKWITKLLHPSCSAYTYNLDKIKQNCLISFKLTLQWLLPWILRQLFSASAIICILQLIYISSPPENLHQRPRKSNNSNYEQTEMMISGTFFIFDRLHGPFCWNCNSRSSSWQVHVSSLLFHFFFSLF